MWLKNTFNAKRTETAGESKTGSLTGGQLSTQVLRQLSRLYLSTEAIRPRQAGGARTGTMRKPASEFREHRQYAPGDDIRFIDWKASARQEHVFIKQNDDPKAALVYLLVDCSASMAWGEPSKAEMTRALTNLLGYLALAHHDRLVVLSVSGGSENRSTRNLGPLWGKGQAAMLNQYVQALPFGGQVDLARSLAGIGQRTLSQGGLVIVISDLLGTPDLSLALGALPAPAWKVVVCHLLHPDEISPALNGHFEMVDIETGQKKLYPVTPKILETYRQRLRSWQNTLAQTCLERGATYTMLPTNASITQTVIPQLLRTQVVKRQ